MLLSLQHNEFNKNNIHINTRVPNTIIKNSDFYRLSYEVNNVSINGIYLFFELKNMKIENIYNKIKFIFNVRESKDLINYLISVEHEILDCFVKTNNYNNKKINYYIKNQLNEGSFKIYNDKHFTNKFVLKISGIWCNENEVGVSYKFFSIN